MRLEVELISKKQIKPSSPTPNHLRHLQLSFLDQIQVPIFMPSVLFFSQNPSLSNFQRSYLLKKSLSEALTIFYPLAGRVKNNSHIDCNDQGVLFVEAKANSQLSHFLRNRHQHHNEKLIPFQPDEAGDLAAFVQITFFNCGGLAISFAMSHKLGDALSQFFFQKCWAAIARGNTNTNTPPLSFGSAALFPPRNLSGVDPTKWVVKENTVAKLFEFSSSAISALRAKYTVKGEKLSRVQALAVFIWSRLVAVAQAKPVKRQYMMIHAVNLRPRMVPPLPEQSFGNLISITAAEADMDAKEDECYGIVKKMKDSITDVNMDFVRNLQKGDGHLNFLKEKGRGFEKGEVVRFSFTSLCNFPIYEADFGWGKPEWVGYSAGMFFKDLVIFLDSKQGQGIEAWISLKKEDMAEFEVDEQLLSHLSSTPNGNNYNLKFDSLSRL